ncbi:transporter substrate-binding domain-containing protein [Streptococcus didelphis]|uniref:transporter substrate-binding domain-containing protein n=1 Tax=Streptococcus didelphis TaxID=102886 RepID=UPI0003A306D7|nr:transporter substrate-binding domain-containing protein [Streptococcus didelphis]
MKRLCLTMIAVFVSVLLVACGGTKGSNADANWKAIQERGTLKVATSGTLFPQSFHDKQNKLTGYDVEIIKEIGKRLNLNIKFTEMGVDGMLSALNSGQIDVAGYSIEKDSKNAKKFLYTDSHKYSFGSMIVRQSDDSGIKSLKDLKGKKAAGASTTSYMKVAKKFGAELVIYDNVTNDVYLQDVANGRTDVILNDFYLQTMASKALPEIPVKVLKDVYYNPSESNFALKLGNKTLQKKMNKALEEMKKDGTLTKLSKKFFAGQDVSKEKKYDFKKIDVSDVE